MPIFRSISSNIPVGSNTMSWYPLFYSEMMGPLYPVSLLLFFAPVYLPFMLLILLSTHLGPIIAPQLTPARTIPFLVSSIPYVIPESLVRIDMHAVLMIWAAVAPLVSFGCFLRIITPPPGPVELPAVSFRFWTSFARVTIITLHLLAIFLHLFRTMLR